MILKGSHLCKASACPKLRLISASEARSYSKILSHKDQHNEFGNQHVSVTSNLNRWSQRTRLQMSHTTEFTLQIGNGVMHCSRLIDSRYWSTDWNSEWLMKLDSVTPRLSVHSSLMRSPHSSPKYQAGSNTSLICDAQQQFGK